MGGGGVWVWVLTWSLEVGTDSVLYVISENVVALSMKS